MQPYETRVISGYRTAVDLHNPRLVLTSFAPGVSELPADPLRESGLDGWLAGRPGVFATDFTLIQEQSDQELVLEPHTVSRRLLFVEVPGFYAAVERAEDGALRERPVIVGGDPRKRGIVQAATPDALAEGVEEGMLVLEALERCPRARALRTEMTRYRQAAKRLRHGLIAISERLESVGLGAVVLEVTDRPEPSAALAEAALRVLRDELALDAQVGVAPVRFVAEVAAREAGPGRHRVVEAGEVARFLAPLPVGRLPGVGPNTQERLGASGVKTIGDVVRRGRDAMEADFGNNGLNIWTAAMGQGSDRVRRAPHPGSVSREQTLAKGESDRAELDRILEALAKGLSHQLELEGLRSKRLVLKVRFEDGIQTTRSHTSERSLSAAEDILGIAGRLLGRADVGDRRVRLMGLSANQLARESAVDPQLPLFPRAK